MKKKYSMLIESNSAPVVELDSEAHAAYVRFSDHPVAKTKLLVAGECIVTADYDSQDKVIGVELIGVSEFGVEPLLKTAGFSPLSKELLDRTRYISVPRRELQVA